MLSHWLLDIENLFKYLFNNYFFNGDAIYFLYVCNVGRQIEPMFNVFNK